MGTGSASLLGEPCIPLSTGDCGWVCPGLTWYLRMNMEFPKGFLLGGSSLLRACKGREGGKRRSLSEKGREQPISGDGRNEGWRG